MLCNWNSGKWLTKILGCKGRCIDQSCIHGLVRLCSTSQHTYENENLG